MSNTTNFIYAREKKSLGSVVELHNVASVITDSAKFQSIIDGATISDFKIIGDNVSASVSGEFNLQTNKNLNITTITKFIDLDNKCIRVGKEMFLKCLELTDFKSENVQYFDDYAFSLAKKLKEIKSNYDGVYIGTQAFKTCVVCVFEMKIATLHGSYQFHNCRLMNFNKVSFTQPVDIPNYAFYRTGAGATYTSVDMPEIISVGVSSFYRSTVLTKKVKLNNLTNLNRDAFRLCNFEDFEGLNVTTATNGANRCFSSGTLKNIKLPKFKKTSVFHLDHLIFGPCAPNANITVNIAMKTSNSGGIDADLVRLRDNGATIVYAT